ncbi:unnamed protein product, partial [Bubo scandiacus]
DCSKDQHSFKTPQHIPGEMLLDEASRNDLAAEASLGSPGAWCHHDSVMSRELAAMRSHNADAVCD